MPTANLGDGAAFTPGPWVASVDDSGDNLSVRAGDDLCVVGGCGCCGSPFTERKSAEANAHLIAAAPEGFDLIEQLEESFTADGTYSAFLPAMRAYLAKARGQ